MTKKPLSFIALMAIALFCLNEKQQDLLFNEKNFSGSQVFGVRTAAFELRVFISREEPESRKSMIEVLRSTPKLAP